MGEEEEEEDITYFFCPEPGFFKIDLFGKALELIIVFLQQNSKEFH